ncbi:UDP-N-acetylmuramoyl-L-alanine--D-glutamate ligase [Candidatus Kaiserbacteria bacterium]|nr:UDP-N-acetylmuramoyl-L-alanine--D-glutamate ligase [Candidatus Kaiserbacteria bacterium]
MNDYQALFEGKKITVMGLGLLGRAVGDAAFLAAQGAQVTVTDMKTEDELAGSVAQLRQYPNITFHLGGHDEKDFTDTDMVLKAAGVRIDSPYIAAARRAGVPVYMSTALFAKYARQAGTTIVGVTGTRGKSTVTHMIYHCLQKAGKKAVLGGNVRGVSTLAMLPDVRAGDIAVLELDSWQLQGFGDLQISPQIAVFTNLLPDHQNYYQTMDEYFADKANIFKYQKEGDSLVVGEQVAERIAALPAGRHGVVPPAIPQDWQIKMPGEHNRENAALAAGALRALGLNDMEIKESLESFEGVEGRLQFVGEKNGVKIYNDNNATTPEATIAALKSLHNGNKNIVLIMGGADKGLDMNVLLYEIAGSCKRVILLAGTGTSRIAPLMADVSIYDDLSAAIHEALASASPGDTILFSPAFSSFGMFKNEYDRNDQFLTIVKNMLPSL